MNININNSIINFGKTLKARTSVLNAKGDSVPCSIYKINPHTDGDYFEKLSNDENWQNSEYVDFLDEEIPYVRETPENEFFVLETNKGECIAISEVTEKPKKYVLDILETSPICVNDRKHKNAKYKYAGETIISFLAKMAAKHKKECIQTEPVISAKKFYTDKCHFSPRPDAEDYHVFLNNKDYNTLIRQNETHTNSKIELLNC